MLKVSIVTPNYNGMPYLRQCLETVVREKPDQYVVVDGHSTDGSLELFNAFKPQIDHLISEPDSGMYDALNKGFQFADGDVLGYLNSDDYYLPGALSAVREIFTQFPDVGWITTSFAVGAREDGAIIHCKKIDPFLEDFHNAGLYQRNLGISNCRFIPQEATFWRKSLWESFGGFSGDLKLAGDYAFWTHCFKQAPLYHVSLPLAVFRSRSGQLSEEMDAYLEECQLLRRPKESVLFAKQLGARLSLRWRSLRRSYPYIKYSMAEGRWAKFDG